jgi:ribosome recycling factor
MLDEALELARDGMAKAVDRLRKELTRVRAGRANPALLDSIKVESYGVQMALNQVATVSVGDARLLVIKPYDRNTIQAIEKAINHANLGLNPSNDGVIIRVPIPALTEQRRRELVKQVKDHGEEAKIAIRQVRREANEMLKEAQKDGDLSEDDLARGLEKIQDMTDADTKTVDQLLQAKEKEIIEV